MSRFKSLSPPSPFLRQGPGEGRGPAEFHDLAQFSASTQVYESRKNRFTVTVKLQFARINERRAARKNGRYRLRAGVGDTGCAQECAARVAQEWAKQSARIIELRARMGVTGCAQELASHGAKE